MKRIPLRTARKAKRLTQAQLAARLGRPQSYVSKLEIGERTNITIGEVAELARVLGVDPSALRFDKPEAVAS